MMLDINLIQWPCASGIAGWKRGAFLLRPLGKPGQQTGRGMSKLQTQHLPLNTTNKSVETFGKMMSLRPTTATLL